MPVTISFFVVWHEISWTRSELRITPFQFRKNVV